MKKQNNITETPLIKLTHQRETLISGFLAGSIPDFLRQHTRILDSYFHESYENSIIGPQISMTRYPYAIIALGGYGRQEQCIHSDVDLLLLFEKDVPDAAEELVREVIYPLWDIGLDVGHATRTLDGCITAALEDIETLTALLDARFICGMSRLYSALMDRLREKFVLETSGTVIDRLVDRNQERHVRFGDSSFLLEPNLKEGDGGLRDYHTVLWIARLRENLTQPRDLEYQGCFSHREFSTLTEALSFIWAVRNHLHHLAGRKCDQLYFRHQEKLADIMGYCKKDGQQPVERFLGELHRHMAFLKAQYEMHVYELENKKKQKRRRKPRVKTRIEGIEVQNGLLGFESPGSIRENPALLIRIFEESARLHQPLSAESERLVGEFLHLADRTSAAAIRSFENILVTRVPRFNVLEAMLRTGFLAKFIPQFDQIVNRIQYDEYHLYPVDRHLLRTVQTIKKFGTPDDPTGNPLCGDLYREIADPKLLLWAGLFHDIGKGETGGNHSARGEEIVRDILREKGYPEEAIGTVAFLVRNHLFLIKIATRRDIQDEETAIFCAHRIQDTERLKMLYLLTVADSVSTGPKAWNSWTATLLEELFLNVLNTLQNGELTSGEFVEIVEKKRAALPEAAAMPPEALQTIDMLFNVMSPRYLLYTPSEAMGAHIRLYTKLEERPFVWDIARSSDGSTRTVTVCAKDGPGLFSRIAGTFTLNGIDILDAQVYTWRNNIALDVFEVKPPSDLIYEDQKWENTARDLESALKGDLDLGQALKEKMRVYGPNRPVIGDRPDQVMIDNEVSSFFTIIEVFSYDVPGLLFGITDALFKCRLDVWVAKIATKIDQVVDVFYVRDFDGQKVDAPEQVAAIRAALKKVLSTTGPSAA
ncbi:[protein-PII] uridylyltransferase [Desulfonema ishimotonii]|uniref:Bifunctional uridylyltransferase/uridylyl-removing enzyme n=1 Tax=Desulfonema ishimotonii TaxID=45657 RepID=A0A401G0I8_9BACT|nr:[protein-PII] uridylyltransferase [Desulfonema ishimotonii]GBC62734.1 [protein-PII] uridylyltransferase [Desulfonema ishimotonii]